MLAELGWHIVGDRAGCDPVAVPDLPAGVRWVVRAYSGECRVDGYNVPDWALDGHRDAMGERFPVRAGERAVYRERDDLVEYLECVEA